MSPRKFIIMLFIIISLIGLLPLAPSQAQDVSNLPATVVADYVNVRIVPSRGDRSYDNRIGQLNSGDEIIVYQVETINSWDSLRWPWVYMVHPASGLEGWVNSEFLLFERIDWQDVLPQVTSFEELSQTEGQVHQPFTSRVYGGAHEFINARAEPYYGAPIRGKFRHGEQIEVTGASLINGYVIYVYAHNFDENNSVEGWVWVGAIGNTIYTPEDNWAYELPILQEVDVRYLPYVTTRFNFTRIRSAPALDAPIVSYAWRRNEPRLYVLGRTTQDGDGWIYVTLDEGLTYRTGSHGWVYDPIQDPLIIYPEGVSRASLPVIAP